MPQSLLRCLLFLTLPFLASVSLWAQQMRAFVDRPLQAYGAGETVVFKVQSDLLRGELNYRIRYGARSPILAEGRVSYSGGVIEIPFTPAAEACFLNFEANLAGLGAAVTVTVGRDQISSLVDEPADFDAFWNAQKGALAAIPLDLQRWQVAETPLSTTYQFSAAQVNGRRVYGFVVVPKGTGPIPASLRLPPFGRGPNAAQPDIDAAEKTNLIAATITIHNAQIGQEDPKAYLPDDLRSPETIYYRFAILAAIRAIDVIAAETRWDRRNLLVYGDSQGGGLAMLVAGIDSRVTLVAQSVAALSRHGAERFDRPSGFPYFLETAMALYPDAPAEVDRAFSAIRYFDAVFAARRFQGASLHFTNYLDPTCPPATNYAAFNAMNGPKVVLHSFDLYHNNSPEFTEDLHDFTRAHIPAANEPPFPFATRRKGYVIDAGSQLRAQTGARAQFRPFVTYDSRAPEADWTFTWSKVSGPGEVTFDNGQSLNAGATFSEPGEYRIRLQVIDPYPEQPRKYWLLSDELSVVVAGGNPTTSASEVLAAAQSLMLFPNPVTDVLRIQAKVAAAESVQLDLTDVLGRCLRETVYPVSAGRLDVQLPVGDLPRGAYTFTVSAPGFAPVSRSIVLN